MFFLVVKTNVGYSVVREFVVQSETAEQIVEALAILPSWKPEWQPLYFMTDYSEAEMGAIATVFPTCQLHLCDCHRKQAWERWTKDQKHGLSSDDADVFLSLLAQGVLKECHHNYIREPIKYRCSLGMQSTLNGALACITSQPPNLVPRPSLAPFLAAYMTFEPP